MGQLNRPVSRPVALLAAAVLATMAAGLGAGIVVTRHTNTTIAILHNLAVDADIVTDRGDALTIALLDAESNLRGYAMSRRDAFLAPYQEGRAAVLANRQAFAESVERFPALAPDMQAVTRLIDQRMAQMERGLAILMAGPDSAIQTLLQSDSGRSTGLALRSVIKRIVQTATEERDRRTVEERDSEQRLRISTTLGGVAAVLLLGTAALALLVGRQTLLRAQAAQHVQSALWQATVQNLQDGVAVFDPQGRLLQWNANLAPVAGFLPAMLHTGLSFAHFQHAASQWDPPVLHGAPPRLDQADSPSTPTEVQVGERVLEVLRSAMPDGGQMLTVRDITRRAAAEAIARQAQKMDVLGQLTGGVAHDFNNMLQIISANLELMADRLDSGTADAAGWLRRRVGAAMEGVERGARLTRHLLAFARRQPLAPAAIETVELMTGLEDMLRRTLGPTIVLELVVAPGLWPLRADAQQLQNAILNLAINARDAMAGAPIGHSTLVIEARNVTLDDAYCAANLDVQPGPYVMMAVSDTGSGMTQEQIERAIEPFYTTKPEGQGTGLGLSMVYGFAKQSGGHLKLYSEPGEGTTVRLYIPRSDRPVQTEAPPHGAEPAKDGGLVLLVEDDAAVRAAAAAALQGLGYTVQEAANADAAMLLLDDGLRPDVLFTDVMMPGTLSARPMAERAQRLVPGLAVVFTSGYTENAIVHHGRLDPGVTLVSKPWRLDELALTLQKAREAARDAAERPAPLRILLVENEPLVRMAAADMLREMHHAVLEAADGADALRQLGGVDLMIADFGLAGMDGLALAARARETRPDLPVMIASGQPPPGDGAEGLIWLSKPYDRAALRAAVQRVAVGQTLPVK